MTLISLILTALALSMDAFAVAVGKGLSISKPKFKDCLIVGLWFGIFQALMPLIGYFLGVSFEKFITNFDHWVAFGLLALLGIFMIKEAFNKKEEQTDASLAPKQMAVLAFSTSVDALAAGVTFAFVGANIALSISVVGGITLILCVVGVKIGSYCGLKFKKNAKLVGGIILILIGLKILLDHLGVLNLGF